MSGRLRTGILIMKKTILLFLLLIGYAETSSAQLFGPRNYEDCIIEGMQGVTSDVAAVSIRSACREKFPQSQKSGSTTDSIGWEIENSGIGRCYLMWDGANFVETAVRLTPVNFAEVKISTPRDTKVTFFIPQALKPREGEGRLQQAWRLSGYNFDIVYCGK